MSNLKLYRVDDGSISYMVAKSLADARAKWVQYVGTLGYGTEAKAVEDFGEPEIELADLAEAESMQIVTDDEEICEHCRGSGMQVKRITLGDAFREYLKQPEDQRAAFGILCNSEWP